MNTEDIWKRAVEQKQTYAQVGQQLKDIEYDLYRKLWEENDDEETIGVLWKGVVEAVGILHKLWLPYERKTRNARIGKNDSQQQLQTYILAMHALAKADIAFRVYNGDEPEGVDDDF